MNSDFPILAALSVEEAAGAVQLLKAVIARLRAEGRQVAGHIQCDISGDDDCRPDMLLEDVETRERYCISQSLGPGASGCRLDSQALADVAGHTLARLDASADLLLLNRFGKAEAEGRGLRSVFEKAASLGVPVLTCVKQDYRSDWADYTGALSIALPPTEEAVLDWCRAAIASRHDTELQAGH
jgi:nucleoside-triphosphatase THEP1